MSILTMELGEQFLKAAVLAWACFAWGIVVFRVLGGSMHGQVLAKVLILLAPGILTLFGYHSVRQYNVVLAANRIPVSEVADNGGRTVERIDTYIDADGYRLSWAGFSSRSGQQAVRTLLPGATGCEGCNQCPEGCSAGCAGNCECLRGLPCSCEGGCGGFCISESIRF
jgi:hypothetical protein